MITEKLYMDVQMRVNKNLTDFIIMETNPYLNEVTYTINPEMIADAIKKQIPQKPITGKYGSCKCVNQHNIPFINKENRMPYCPFCGQRMDWGEEE